MNKRYKKLNKRVCRILRNEDLNGNICCGLVDLWTDWVDPGKVSSVNTWRVTRFFNAPPFKTNYERVQGVFWQQKQCEANLEKWRVVLWLGINKISGEWDPPPSPQHTARHSGGAETGSEGSGITLDPLTLLWGGGGWMSSAIHRREHFPRQTSNLLPHIHSQTLPFHSGRIPNSENGTNYIMTLS